MSATTSGARPNEGSSSSSRLRAHQQRARDRQHLLLAADKRARLLAAPLLEPRKKAEDAVEIARTPCRSLRI